MSTPKYDYKFFKRVLYLFIKLKNTNLHFQKNMMLLFRLFQYGSKHHFKIKLYNVSMIPAYQNKYLKKLISIHEYEKNSFTFGLLSDTKYRY